MGKADREEGASGRCGGEAPEDGAHDGREIEGITERIRHHGGFEPRPAPLVIRVDEQVGDSIRVLRDQLPVVLLQRRQ